MTAEETTGAKRKYPDSSHRFQDYPVDYPPGKKTKVEQEDSVFSVHEANFVCPLCQFPAKKYSTLQIHMLDHFDVNWEANCDEKEQEDLLRKTKEVLNWFCVPKPSRTNGSEPLDCEASLSLEITAEAHENGNPVFQQQFVQFIKDGDTTDEVFQETSSTSALIRLPHDTGGLSFNASKNSFKAAPKQAQTPDRAPPTQTINNQSNSSKLNELDYVHPAFYNRNKPSPFQNGGIKTPFGDWTQIRFNNNATNVEHQEEVEACRAYSVSPLRFEENSMSYYSASYPKLSTKITHLSPWSVSPNRHPLPSRSDGSERKHIYSASQQDQMNVSSGNNYCSPTKYQILSLQTTNGSTDSSNRSNDNTPHIRDPVLTGATETSHPSMSSKLLNEKSGSTGFTRFSTSGRTDNSLDSPPNYHRSCPCSNYNCTGAREEIGSSFGQNALLLDQRPVFSKEVTDDSGGSSAECAKIHPENYQGDEAMDLTLRKNQRWNLPEFSRPDPPDLKQFSTRPHQPVEPVTFVTTPEFPHLSTSLNLYSPQKNAWTHEELYFTGIEKTGPPVRSVNRSTVRQVGQTISTQPDPDTSYPTRPVTDCSFDPTGSTCDKNQMPSETLPQGKLGNSNPNHSYLQKETFCRNGKSHGYSEWENRNGYFAQQCPSDRITKMQSPIPMNSDSQERVMYNNDSRKVCNEIGTVKGYASFPQRTSTDYPVDHSPLESRGHSQQCCVHKPETRNYNAVTVRDCVSYSCSLHSPEFGHANEAYLHAPTNKFCHHTLQENVCPQTSAQNSCQHRSPENISHQPVTKCFCHQVSPQCESNSSYPKASPQYKYCYSKPIPATTTDHNISLLQAHNQAQITGGDFTHGTRVKYPTHSCSQGAPEHRSLSEPSVAADRNTTRTVEPVKQLLQPKEYHGQSNASATVPLPNDAATARALPSFRNLPSQRDKIYSLKKTEANSSVPLNLTRQTPFSRKNPIIGDLLQKPGPKPNRPAFDAFKIVPEGSLKLNTKKSFTGHNPEVLDRGVPSPTTMAPAMFNQNTSPGPNQDSSSFACPTVAEQHDNVQEEQRKNSTRPSGPAPSYYDFREFQAAPGNRSPATVTFPRYRCTLCGMIGYSSCGMRRHGTTHNGFIPKIHLVEIGCTRGPVNWQGQKEITM